MEKSIPGRATSAKDGPEKHFLSLARQKRAARARSGVWGRERSVKVKANEKRAMSREDMALFICCLCNSRIFTIGGGISPVPLTCRARTSPHCRVRTFHHLRDRIRRIYPNYPAARRSAVRLRTRLRMHARLCSALRTTAC